MGDLSSDEEAELSRAKAKKKKTHQTDDDDNDNLPPQEETPDDGIVNDGKMFENRIPAGKKMRAIMDKGWSNGFSPGEEVKGPENAAKKSNRKLNINGDTASATESNNKPNKKKDKTKSKSKSKAKHGDGGIGGRGTEDDIGGGRGALSGDLGIGDEGNAEGSEDSKSSKARKTKKKSSKGGDDDDDNDEDNDEAGTGIGDDNDNPDGTDPTDDEELDGSSSEDDDDDDDDEEDCIYYFDPVQNVVGKLSRDACQQSGLILTGVDPSSGKETYDRIVEEWETRDEENPGLTDLISTMKTVLRTKN